MKLIDKDKIVREIERKLNSYHPTEITSGRYALQDLLSFLDNLEVKVDLENSVKGIIDYPFIGVDFPNIYPNYKELKDYCDKNGIKDNDEVKIIIIKDVIL